MSKGQVQQLIDLAKQVGGKAWQALLQQQQVIGVQELVWAGFLLLVSVALTIFVVKCVKYLFRGGDDAYDDAAMFCVIAGIFGGLGGAASWCVTFGLAVDGIGHILYPQAYAIGAILGN